MLRDSRDTGALGRDGMARMQRRAFLIGSFAGLMAGPALASRDFVEEIVRELKDQGYRKIQVSRTMLGRMRITAENERGSREIIVNPATGEILRDLRTSGATEDILGGENGNSGKGKGDVDDDDDDDDDGGDDKDGEGGGSGEGGGDHGGGDDDGGDDD